MSFHDEPWDIQFDEKFREAYDDLEGSGFQDRVQDRVKKIANNPLTGEPKTGVLKGTRTTHVEHLIIQWELIPEIHRRAHLNDLEKVYFLNLAHHDEMLDIGRRGATDDETITFRVEFDQWEVGAVLNAIHGLEGSSEVETDWSSGPPEVTGKIDERARDRLEDVIPESAVISFDSDSLI